MELRLFIFALFSVIGTINSECMEGWYRGHSSSSGMVTDSCYYFSYRKMTWKDAQAYCKSVDAMLAEVETADENTWLENFAHKIDTTYYLGGTDEESEGVWKWASGKNMIFTDWYPGEPNNIYQNNENCLAIFKDEKYHWNDYPCFVKANFICERSFSKDSPQATEPSETV